MLPSMLRPALLALVSLGAPAALAEETVVAAAVSLREPILEIAAAFEARRGGDRLGLAFGGTHVLAAQVRAGAPIVVLLSADERTVSDLAREGHVAERFVIAHNRLLVMQRADAAIRIQDPADLVGEAVRKIAIPEAAVPVGYYAREWLAGRGLLEPLRGRIVATEHARATLVAVDHGHADAAVVYATDARLAKRARLAFRIDEAEHPPIVYVAARIAGRPSPVADAFLAWLRGESARDSLRRAGFQVPPS